MAIYLMYRSSDEAELLGCWGWSRHSIKYWPLIIFVGSWREGSAIPIGVKYSTRSEDQGVRDLDRAKRLRRKCTPVKDGLSYTTRRFLKAYLVMQDMCCKPEHSHGLGGTLGAHAVRTGTADWLCTEWVHALCKYYGMHSTEKSLVKHTPPHIMAALPPLLPHHT